MKSSLVPPFIIFIPRHSLLFFFNSCYLQNACVWGGVVYMCSWIHKYNLLSLYNVTCIYVFRTDHWYWITNQYTHTLGRLLFHSLVACSSLCMNETLWVWLLTFLGDMISQHCLFLWLLQSSRSLFCNDLSHWDESCYVDEFTRTRLHNSAFWLDLVFCNDIHLLQREVWVRWG